MRSIIAVAFFATATFSSCAVARPPIDPVLVWYFGFYSDEAFHHYMEASRKLGYIATYPSVPGRTSPWHQEQIDEIERLRRERERTPGDGTGFGGIGGREIGRAHV